MELAHRNLLKIYATGSSVLNGVPIVYVVMERADESLKSVLAERALTEDETRELLVPAAAALRYLHGKGYAHSRLGASNILAVRDQLKLSSDNAIRVNDGGSTAEDMKSLGVLIVQALTQQIPNGDRQAELDVLREAPHPFPDIVRHCLDPDSVRRWTAEQVEATLKGPAAEPVLPARTPPAGKVPAVEVRTVARAEQEDPDEAHSKRGIPRWIYAGLAALILIVVLAAVMQQRNGAPVAVAPPAAAPQQALGTEVADGLASAGVPSPARGPDPGTEATPTVSRVRGRKADGWSVIVAAPIARANPRRNECATWRFLKLGCWRRTVAKLPNQLYSQRCYVYETLAHVGAGGICRPCDCSGNA